MKTKTKFRIFLAWVVAGLVFWGCAAGIIGAFAAGEGRRAAGVFFKDDYPAEDTVTVSAGVLPPNVLFFLDSSSAMLFDPRYPMPHVNDTRTGESSADALTRRANMLEWSTWGTGARNMSIVGNANYNTTDYSKDLKSNAIEAFGFERTIDGGQSALDGGPLHNHQFFKTASGGTYQFDVETEVTRRANNLKFRGEVVPHSVGGGDALSFSRFGRDVNAANNIIGPTHYYTPFPDKPYFLTFKNRVLAWGISKDITSSTTWDDLSLPCPYGVTDAEWAAAKTSYEEIHPYMKGSGTISADNPVPHELANKHLVPNDSKVYMLKLALWNLTEPKNAEILSKVNIGVAKNYQEYTRYAINLANTPIRGLAMSESDDIRYKQFISSDKFTYNDNPYALPGERNYFSSNKASIHGIGTPHFFDNPNTVTFYMVPDTKGYSVFPSQYDIGDEVGQGVPVPNMPAHKWGKVWADGELVASLDEVQVVVTAGDPPVYRYLSDQEKATALAAWGQFNAKWGEKDNGNFMFYAGDEAPLGGQQSVGPLVKIGYRRGVTSFNVFMSWSRAIMTVPFGKFYNEDSSVGENLPKLREFIDGIERWNERTISTTAPSIHFPVNDELLPFGAGYLAPAIYGGRIGAGGDGAPLPPPTSYPDVSNPPTTPPTTGPINYHKGILRDTTDSGQGQHLIQYGISNDVPLLIRYEQSASNSSATGIKLEKGMAVGSVIDFFSPAEPPAGKTYEDGLAFNNAYAEMFPVTGSCQQNWLVLFVSGLDPISTYSNDKAVELLFKNTLTMRGREPDGVDVNGKPKWKEKDVDYSMDSGVRTIVVGFVNDDLLKPEYRHLLPKDEKQANGIKSQVQETIDGLTKTAQWGDPVLETGGDPTKPEDYLPNLKAKPYFVKNVGDLTNAIEEILRRITAVDMGSGAPVSLPPLETGATDGSRTILGASFKINDLDQWNANLNRINIDAKGNETTVWSADAKMRGAALGRKLYTIGGSGGSPVQLSLPASKDFENWLYKFDLDTNHDDSNSIGVLGEMSRSNVLVVGEPKEPTLKDAITRRDADNDYSVYVQTNRGFLHSFNYATGAERWGFVPPNIFNGRLQSLWIGNDNTTTARLSNPMYLLDGKIIAKDVRIGSHGFDTSKYATVLVGYLGRGGNGFYAMDITEANVTQPKFLWAIENANYGAGTARQNVVGWGNASAASVGSSGDEYDYSKLGLTIVPGVFITPPPAGATSIDVGVLPGGLGHNFGVNSSDTQGKAIYIFDPEDGSILQEISTLGMAISPIVYQEYKDQATGAKLTSSFYTADSEGNILFCDTSGSAPGYGRWGVNSVFSLLTVESPDLKGNLVSEDLPIVVPYALVHARSGAGHDWLFGGTADIAGPGSVNSSDMVLQNKQQLIFGLNVTKMSEDSYGKNTGDLIETTYFKDKINPPYASTSYNGPDKSVDTTSFGWYLRLRPEIPPENVYSQGTEAEYVSAPPFLFNGTLYVGTFIPYTPTTSQLTCENIGVGKLYSLSPSTGAPLSEPTTLDNVKIVGFSGSGSRLAISVQELRPDAVKKAASELKDGKMLAGGSIIEMDAAGGIPVSPPPILENVPYIEYWREKFQ